MARYDDPEFIKAQNLNPEEWHVVGVPTPQPNAVTGQVPSTRSQTTYTITLAGPGGAVRIVTMTPQGPGIDASNVRLEQLDWSVSGVSEAIKPPAETQAETNAQILKAQQDALAAQTLAAQREQQLRDLQKDNEQRDANKASTGYSVTDVERATIENNGRQANLTQQQIDNQLKVASDNNQISRTSNEIAATNAATNAFNAQRNAEAMLAETTYKIRGGDLAEAQFEREKADRDIANRISEDKLKLEQLQQRQANEIAQGQLGQSAEANAIRQRELVQRGEEAAATLEQRQAEAKQTAETAALGQGAQAAASTFGAERQFQANAAQTGGNLLQNRAQTFQNLSQAPFTQAASLSQGSAGRFGMLGGGLHSVPEGAVQNIMQGAMGVSTGLYGGQSALQAAAQAIEQIRPGAAMTPMGQAAAAIITQIQDRAAQILKGGQVNAPATAGPAAAAEPAAAATVEAPVTAPEAQPRTWQTPAETAEQSQARNQQFMGQDIQELMRQQMQQHLTPQMSGASAMMAPTTQPTININF